MTPRRVSGAAHLKPEPVVQFSGSGQVAHETIWRTREQVFAFSDKVQDFVVGVTRGDRPDCRTRRFTEYSLPSRLGCRRGKCKSVTSVPAATGKTPSVPRRYACSRSPVYTV